MEKIRFKTIAPKIYWLDFNTQEDLTMSFLRFQEHYESPEFKDKIFTLGQYREWYKTTRESGEFSYYTDWNGFNVPSYIFKPFVNGLFDPQTEQESRLIATLTLGGVDFDSDFYVIGTHSGQIDVLEHEICHALYYVNSEYRDKMNQLMSEHDLSELHQILINMGYHKDLCEDEAHAYICTGFEEGYGMTCPDSLREAMITVKDQYYPDIA